MGNLFSHDIGSNSSTRILQRFFNASIEHTYTKIALQDTIEDAIAADAIPMEVLIALFAEYKDSHGKSQGILKGTSGITSVISSSIFIWMIMRSHERLSTTQHRIFLGLCISDIIYSLSKSTFGVMAPSEVDYWAWNARGNQATCNAQGFLESLGQLGGLFYNASLNLYFLAVVKYKKSDEFIRAKIEPFLHGVPIIIALSGSIYKLVKKHYNTDPSGNCSSPITTAPHCVGYDVGEIREGFDTPCWRGSEGIMTAYFLAMVFMLIPAVIMVVSLGMIYRAVRTQEKKLARYGVGALRSNLQQQPTGISPQEDTPQQSSFWGGVTKSLTALSTSLQLRTWSCRKTIKPVTRSNNVQSQSRAVMLKAFGYSFAWFLSWGLWIIFFSILFATGSLIPGTGYIINILCPLQGFFNLLIFMHPKILAVKKSKKRGGETISWCQAFTIAFWSRGKGNKKKASRPSNLRGGHSNRLRKKSRYKGLPVDNVKAPLFGKKKKKRPESLAREEEKCEIQMPDNLNPNVTKKVCSAASTATYAPNISPSSETTAGSNGSSSNNNNNNNRLTVNHPDAAAMTVKMKKGHGENIHLDNTLSDVKEDPHDGDDMSNQEQETKEVKGDSVDAEELPTTE